MRAARSLTICRGGTRNEGHYSCWRFGHETVPVDHGHVEAAAPGVRQADDLLSPERPDDGCIRDILIISTPKDLPNFERL